MWSQNSVETLVGNAPCLLGNGFFKNEKSFQSVTIPSQVWEEEAECVRGAAVPSDGSADGRTDADVRTDGSVRMRREHIIVVYKKGLGKCTQPLMDKPKSAAVTKTKVAFYRLQ